MPGPRDGDTCPDGTVLAGSGLAEHECDASDPLRALWHLPLRRRRVRLTPRVPVLRPPDLRHAQGARRPGDRRRDRAPGAHAGQRPPRTPMTPRARTSRGVPARVLRSLTTRAAMYGIIDGAPRLCDRGVQTSLGPATVVVSAKARRTPAQRPTRAWPDPAIIDT